MTLRLDSLSHLFEPNPDAFAESHSVESGFDSLLSSLLAQPPRDAALKTTIVLPAHEIDAGTGERVRAAVARHCEARLCHNRNEAVLLRRQGSRTLFGG